jgi:hypothetical protein
MINPDKKFLDLLLIDMRGMLFVLKIFTEHPQAG